MQNQEAPLVLGGAGRSGALDPGMAQTLTQCQQQWKVAGTPNSDTGGGWDGDYVTGPMPCSGMFGL